MGLLNITTSDLNSSINPTNNPNYILVGSGASNFPTARATEIIDNWDSYVCSRLPEKYRRMLTKVEGEILVTYATNNLTTVTTGLKPISNLMIYPNYSKNWKNRFPIDTLDTDDYSYVALTGVITFDTALVDGTSIICEYNHTNTTTCNYLRRIAICLAHSQILEEMPTFTAGMVTRIQDLRQQAYGDLDRLRKGESGLQMFDQLLLIEEKETQSEGGAFNIEYRGGMI